MFRLIPTGTQIDFVGKRRLWLGISVVTILTSFAIFLTKGIEYGIDFSGGAEIHVKVPADWGTAKLREALDGSGLEGTVVVQVGEPSQGEFLVRAKSGETEITKVSENVKTALSKAASGGLFEVLREDVVGPAAGALLRQKGFLAMFYALLAILIYVGLRFDFRYAPGAVVALFHDTVITLGILAALGIPFDMTILAAILALIGYSNNDTIIVFDRVRETTHMHPTLSIDDTVNRSVNETLGRTLVTSLTTFIVAFTLWLIGGPVIQNFAFTFMVGIVVGTYSSIFIASSLVITITHWNQKRQALQASNGAGKRRREYVIPPEPRAH